MPEWPSEPVRVGVELLDINDHPPRFRDADKTLEAPAVPEDTPPGTQILAVDVIARVLSEIII